jgi:hypothetical protein
MTDRAKIRQIILYCSIRRLSAEETVEQLNLIHGISVNVRTVVRYRANIRNSASKWVSNLAKSKRGEYIACYRGA